MAAAAVDANVGSSGLAARPGRLVPAGSTYRVPTVHTAEGTWEYVSPTGSWEVSAASAGSWEVPAVTGTWEAVP